MSSNTRAQDVTVTRQEIPSRRACQCYVAKIACDCCIEFRATHSCCTIIIDLSAQQHSGANKADLPKIEAEICIEHDMDRMR